MTVIMDRSYRGALAFIDRRYWGLTVTYQRTATIAVDQEPRDERSQEEPRVEEPSHESGSVCIEAETVLEQSAGIICTVVRIGHALEKLNGSTYRSGH